MTELLQNPAHKPVIGALIFGLLVLWPLARIFRRNGQSPFLCLLALGGIVFPFAGYILPAAAFLLKRKKAVA